MNDSTVLDRLVLTPLDTEQTLPNMAMGDLLVGSFAGNQIGYNRPFAGAGRYRTPVDGLCLCGGSTHPGGNITGLCGYNAAAVIVADLAIKPWWNPPIIDDVLTAIGSCGGFDLAVGGNRWDSIKIRIWKLAETAHRVVSTLTIRNGHFVETPRWGVSTRSRGRLPKMTHYPSIFRIP